MGGTIGGPIKKDKTFYFVNVEGLIDISARSPSRRGVPSAAMRKGDFGEICATGFSSSGICADPERAVVGSLYGHLQPRSSEYRCARIHPVQQHGHLS